MIATHNQQAAINGLSSKEPNLTPIPAHIQNKSIDKSSQLLLLKNISHHPQAGLNPVADAAAYLFSVLGKLKELKSYRQLSRLQKELIQEIDIFYEAVCHLGYKTSKTFS